MQEIRDPIHNFIYFDEGEKRVIDSRPLQRLRHIHQLALSSLIYPGAVHKRFGHSLGVMELAGRVYDVITHPANVHQEVDHVVPGDRFELQYWRKVLRLAALCHDIGHLPFSHAAERDLLPEGWDHERIAVALLQSPELNALFNEIKVQAKDIIKLAVGPSRFQEEPFDSWEALLSEIIVGDAFGVDRMDYLLRDSYHAGVVYGKFDHYRLIDTLRILPKGEGQKESSEPVLGVTEGGLLTAEALILARYFMYSQVYFHHVRRIYDIHLKDYLSESLPGGRFSVDVEDHLSLTDNEILSGLYEASRNNGLPGHVHAARIVERRHFRRLYSRDPLDYAENLRFGETVFQEACNEFGEENLRYDRYSPKGVPLDFPVLMSDGRVQFSINLSETMRQLPVITVESIFVAPELRREAEDWLETSRRQFQKTKGAEQ